jgi:N-acetylmuramoyl-L-alanine amidase
MAAVAAAVALAATMLSAAQTAAPAGAAAKPQTVRPDGAAVNRNLVVLDPAHGGPDAGAALGDNVQEKDVTLALGARLRAALTAAGFNVVSTRDAELAAVLTTDQRAETANRARAGACLVLHATATGVGVHVYTSAVAPAAVQTADSPEGFVPTPWDEAQAGSVSESVQLAGDLSSRLAAARVPSLLGAAPLRPLDNLMCPAVAIEMAPMPVAGQDPTPVTDAEYQRRVVSIVTAALRAMRDRAGAGAAVPGAGR